MIVPFAAISRSLDDTARIAGEFATLLKPTDVVELVGDLGAGKTTFVKSLAASFGIDPDSVLSPTFVLCRTYEGIVPLHHCDLYRLESAEEAEEAGILETIGDGITLIEWADPIRSYLPKGRYVVRITKIGETERRIEGSKE